MKQVLLFAAVAACALASQANTDRADASALSNTSQASAQLGASDYVVIEFEQGRTALLPEHKDKLRELATVAGAGEKREIEVLAWADREYPATGETATKEAIKLADQRAQAVEAYLEKDLKLSKVEPHNMAKRPNMFSELFKTDDFEVKKTFEQTGASPAEQESGINKMLMAKSSKVVVFVKRD